MYYLNNTLTFLFTQCDHQIFRVISPGNSIILNSHVYVSFILMGSRNPTGQCYCINMNLKTNTEHIDACVGPAADTPLSYMGQQPWTYDVLYFMGTFLRDVGPSVRQPSSPRLVDLPVLARRRLTVYFRSPSPTSVSSRFVCRNPSFVLSQLERRLFSPWTFQSVVSEGCRPAPNHWPPSPSSSSSSMYIRATVGREEAVAVSSPNINMQLVSVLCLALVALAAANPSKRYGMVSNESSLQSLSTAASKVII